MAAKSTHAKLSQAEVQQEKERLERELNEAGTELAEIEQHLEDRGDYSLGEGDPAIQTWELNLALYQRARDKAESIRAALQRIAEGTYGVCQRCGKRIDRARLEIIPDASLCIECARHGGE
jgi:RNA polymerase-binding protein DksA